MPTNSAFPQFQVPKEDIWGFLFERKDRTFPDNKRLYTDPETKRYHTYYSIEDTAQSFGKGLKDSWNWKKGDALALYSPNSINTPAIMLGTLWAGGVLTPANPAYTAKELAFQLKDSKAKAIVTQMHLVGNVIEAARLIGLNESRILLMDGQGASGCNLQNISSFCASARESRHRRSNIMPEKDLAFLVYSSGTTGLPKGVMLTHTNICSNLRQLEAAEGDNLRWDGGYNNEGDKLLAFLPFYHIYGLTCLIMQSCLRGVELVVMMKFELERFCQIIQEHHISFVYLVPPVLVLLSKHELVKKYDLSSIRMANSGAAPLTRELVDAVNKRIHLPVKQGYGLSETSPITHVQGWSEWYKTMGSIGKLLPNMSAKFLDEDLNEVSVGQTGELALKGPNVFMGYLNKPELTRTAFTEDGYFRTGDVGYQDDQGNFYITDRAKELIKYNGFQVAPAELEGLLIDHPLIEDAAVIGVYSKELASELPRAYVVLRSGAAPTEALEDEIKEWVAQQVAYHKWLRGGIKFILEVPKSASGKILRRLLKDAAKGEEVSKARL